MSPLKAVLENVPWRVAGAIGLLLVGSLVPGRRRVPERRLRTLWLSAAITCVTFFGRRALVSPSFFHQHGQGPIWSSYTFARASASEYGPGYRELYGLVGYFARLRPETLLFPAQQILGACIPVLAFLLARRAGARTPLAMALAAAVAVDPTFARIAASETYYNPCCALLFLAAVALACGGGRASLRTVRFWLSAAAAGLLVAQAARIHPLAWAPAAILPAVVLVARGPLRDRVALTLASAGVMGIAVFLLAATSMKAVLAGHIGATWGPRIAASPLHRLTPPFFIAILTIAAATFFPTARSLLLRIGVALFTLSFARAVNVLAQSESPCVHGAYFRLYAPVFLVAVLAIAADRMAARRMQQALAAVIVGGALVNCVVRGPSLVRLPVDAREGTWMLQVRDSTPTSNVPRLVYLGRTVNENGNVYLPWNFGIDIFRSDQPPFLPAAPRMQTPGGPFYYVHTSLCSTAEGRPSCEAFERAHPMTLVTEQRFSTGPEDELRYLENPVRVRLYRLLDR